MKTTGFRIYGEKRGFIWMPYAECTKDFDIQFSKEPGPFKVCAETLRDALLHITNDGDFQSCGIDWAVLEIERRKEHKTETYSYPLFGNDGNADCYTRADA